MGLLYLAASESDNVNLEHYSLDPVVPPQTLRDRALELMFSAAENGGGGVAQNEIGLAYLEGAYGFDQDFKKAREWLEKALNAGSEIAPYNLARVYSNGLGVTVDADRATSYLALSAKRRYCPARAAMTQLEAVAEGKELATLREVTNPTFSPEACFGFGPLEKMRFKIDALSRRLKQRSALILERAKLNYFGDKRLANAVPPSRQQCEVFQAFLDAQAGGEKIFVAPATIDISEGLMGEGALAPTRFLVLTGETETVELFGEVGDRPAYKEIEVDASSYFDPVIGEAVYALPECFSGENELIEFWSGSLALLLDEKAEAGAFEATDHSLIAIWSLSPLGISADGQYASLYAEYYCGFLCASGDYYLLTKDAAEGWKIFGVHPLWVS